MSGRSFWMVCRTPKHAASETKPQTRYESRAEATEVARRLANTHDAPFTVLEAVGTIHPDGQSKDLFAGT